MPEPSVPSPPTPGAQVTRQATVLRVRLYNLANVAPRLTQTTTIASGDVQQTYGELLKAIETAGGRTVRSQLTRPQADTVAATLEHHGPEAAPNRRITNATWKRRKQRTHNGDRQPSSP